MGKVKRQKLSFGTDGIRGNADMFPFTNQALYGLGRSISYFVKQKKASETVKVLIGMDTRASGDRIKRALVAGLADNAVRIIDAGVTTTPAVCQIITGDQSYDFGIVISASHNPYHDNGIKIFDARQGKLTSDDEQLIADVFNDVPSEGFCLGDDPVVEPLDNVIEMYKKNIKTYFRPNFLKNYRVVLDCGHGASYQLAPEIMRSFGAHVITVNVSPNGKNINENCGALHLESLQEAVKAHAANVGFAFDGDGDRVIAVNDQGEVKNGDDILLLLLELADYQKAEAVVGTIMSNKGFDVALERLSKKLIRTPVGDKYVVAKMQELGLPLGGEASGHIVIRDYLRTGDGLFVALKVLESMIENNNHAMVTFDKFPQVLVNVPVAGKKDLKQLPFATLIDQHKEMLHNGRMIVRYSGTENVLRVMTEDQDYDNAVAIAHGLAHELQQALE